MHSWQDVILALIAAAPALVAAVSSVRNGRKIDHTNGQNLANHKDNVRRLSHLEYAAEKTAKSPK